VLFLRYCVVALAVFGAAAPGGLVAVAATPAKDRVAPTAPANVVVIGTTVGTASIKWDASKDNVGVAGYGLYRDGVHVGTTSDTNATFTGLQPATKYTLAVDAFDAAGNRSAKTSISATTMPDLEPPSTPQALTLAGSTQASVSLSWSPSTDNVGVAGYGLYRNGALLGTTATTSATLDGLTCGTTSTFAVDAFDAAGNRSAQATLTASTQPCPADVFLAPDGYDYVWTHLATTYDGTTLRLYVNGRLEAQQGVSGSMSASTGPLRLGGDSIFAEWFEGLIDDVRIYNRPLDPSEIEADMATPVAPDQARLGLVAAYGLDEGQGATTADASGGGHTGALAGATWTAGHSGAGLSFDGIDDWVSIDDAADLDLSTGMTLEAWVRPAALDQTWRAVVVKEDVGHLVYGLYASTGTGVPSGNVYVGGHYEARAASGLAPSSCLQAAPCLSFDRAYHAAQPGQTIEVAAGWYPLQAITVDPSKISSTDVVFRPAVGAEVTVAGLDVHAKHLELRDLTFSGWWTTNVEADDVTFRNLVARGFIISSSKNVSVIGGSYGPSVDAKPQVAAWPDTIEPENILIDGVTFHDYTRSDATVHMECLQFGAGNGLTVRGSRFIHCDIFNVFFGHFGATPPPRNITVENNFFSTSTDAVGMPTYYSLMFRSPWENTLVRNNSSTQSFGISHDEGTYSNFRLVGNVAPLMPWSCDGSVAYSHNVWQGAQCDPTDKNVSELGFVDEANVDLHLKPGSPAIEAGDPASYPATDIDGEHRPSGATPDAGADEVP
jgi:chitodextrinase